MSTKIIIEKMASGRFARYVMGENYRYYIKFERGTSRGGSARTYKKAENKAYKELNYFQFAGENKSKRKEIVIPDSPFWAIEKELQ